MKHKHKVSFTAPKPRGCPVSYPVVAGSSPAVGKMDLPVIIIFKDQCQGQELRHCPIEAQGPALPAST